MWRQLPAWSPLGLVDVLKALPAAVGSGPSSEVEARVRDEFPGRRVVLTDSGTSALALALGVAMGRGAATRRVLLPAYGCFDLVTATVAAAAHAAFYDIDPATLQPDWDSVAHAARDGACALVIVHQYGVPVDPGPAEEIARAAGALLIEDAAQGIGSRWRGAAVGAVAPLSVLSFGRGKGRTGVRGGALVVDPTLHVSDELVTVLRPREPGWRVLAGGAALVAATRAPLFSILGAIPWMRIGETVYCEPHTPAAMSGAAAAMLLSSWTAAERETSARRARGARMSVLLARASSWRVVTSLPEGDSGYLRLAALFAGPSAPSDPTLGIMRGYPVPLPALPAATAWGGHPSSFPGSLTATQRLVTAPTHSRMGGAALKATLNWFGVFDG